MIGVADQNRIMAASALADDGSLNDGAAKGQG
jgi:hypothetical protein